MLADSPDIQVWIDSQPHAAQTVVIPYVRSVRDMQLSYRMRVLQQSQSGKSQISQSGIIKAEANTPAALSRVSVSAMKDGECRIELTLREGAAVIGNYLFDCRE